MGKFKIFFTYFGYLLLLCLAPLLSDLYSYNRTHVQVRPQNVQYVSIKNTNVSQKIYLEGLIGDLGLRFYAPSGPLYGDALITIKVKQGNNVISEKLLARNLRVASPYKIVDPIHGLEESPKDEMDYYLKKSLLSLNRGSAEISVIANNLPKGTDAFIEVSSDPVSGLPSAYADKNYIGKTFVLQYNVFKFNSHFYYETGLLILLIGLIGFTSWLFTYKSDLFKSTPIILQLLAIFFIILIVGIKNPYACFWGEPRSEATYEFWYKAHYWGLLKSLMSLMSQEALAWLERIFMWVADRIFSVKYVFVGAQLIELGWIAWLCSLACLKYFRQYFSDFARLGISIFLGCFLFFDSMYYFWSCSYWGIIFFACFALLPLNRIPLLFYIAGIILAAILCMSRIYYIILVPPVVVALVILWRKQGRRFKLYCSTIIFFSIFEFIYSITRPDNLSKNSNLMKGLEEIGLFRFVENVVYYQIQVINSLFTGNIHFQGAGVNIVGAIILSVFIYFFVRSIISEKILETLYFGSLGFIGLGSVAVNIFTSGTHYAVSFPMNYATNVDWTQNIYQQADLHFSISYFCVLLLTLGVFYEIQKFTREPFYNDNKNFSLIMGFCGLAILACFSAKPRIQMYEMPVSWKDVYQVTSHQKYFVAVNTWYQTTPISLAVGTQGYTYGIDQAGKLYRWDYGGKQYEFYRPYNQAAIGAVSDISQRGIVSLTAKRALTNFNVKYVAVFKDRNGLEIARVPQAESEEREWLDFIPSSPLINVYSVSFELANGNTAYIEDGLQIGYLL